MKELIFMMTRQGPSRNDAADVGKVTNVTFTSHARKKDKARFLVIVPYTQSTGSLSTLSVTNGKKGVCVFCDPASAMRTEPLPSEQISVFEQYIRENCLQKLEKIAEEGDDNTHHAVEIDLSVVEEISNQTVDFMLDPADRIITVVANRCAKCISVPY